MQSIAFRLFLSRVSRFRFLAVSAGIVSSAFFSLPLVGQAPPNNFDPNLIGPPPIQPVDQSGNPQSQTQSTNPSGRQFLPPVPANLGNAGKISWPNPADNYQTGQQSSDQTGTGSSIDESRFGGNELRPAQPLATQPRQELIRQLGSENAFERPYSNPTYSNQNSIQAQPNTDNEYGTRQNLGQPETNWNQYDTTAESYGNQSYGNSPEFESDRSYGEPMADSMVVPASYQDSFSNQGLVATDLADQYLRQLDVNLIQTTLPGDPISLVETIRQVSPNNRLQAVNEYWKTYTCYAKLRFSQEELRWIEQLHAPAGQADRMLLDAAQQRGRNRVMQSELNFVEAQSQLSRYLDKNQYDLLPLPSDIPLLGRYRTNYAHYKTQRNMPIRLQQLDNSLPKQHQMIHANALTTHASREAVKQTTFAYNQGQATLAATLEAIRLCCEVHDSFADSIRDYNQSTNEYAMGVAPMGQAPEKMVSMLIRTRDSDQLSDIRQARNDSFYSGKNGSNSISDLSGSSNMIPANQVPSYQPGTSVGQESWSQPNLNSMNSMNSTSGAAPRFADPNLHSGNSANGLPPAIPPQFARQQGVGETGIPANNNFNGSGIPNNGGQPNNGNPGGFRPSGGGTFR